MNTSTSTSTSVHQWKDFFKNKTLVGKYVSIYDGDTFKLELPICCMRFIFSCRLLGVDTAEMRTKNLDEKAVAIEAKEYVRKLLSENEFQVVCDGLDKYGRVLCDIVFPTLENKTLTDFVVEQNYGYRYDGGTKQTFEEWRANTRTCL